jgi:hypothetical protein
MVKDCCGPFHEYGTFSLARREWAWLPPVPVEFGHREAIFLLPGGSGRGCRWPCLARYENLDSFLCCCFDRETTKLWILLVACGFDSSPHDLITLPELGRVYEIAVEFSS